MKVVLIGNSGQVGKHLQIILQDKFQLVVLNRNALDLTNLNEISDTISKHQPDWIINAAAYTQVDDAENNQRLADMINRAAVEIIAATAKRLNAWLVHYSTDYVFDGTKSGAYVESDLASPLSVYGQSKLAGEIAIQQSGCQYLILRTSWVVSEFENNFINKVSQKIKLQSAFSVVVDQYGAPTSAKLIAQVTLHCINVISVIDKIQSSSYVGVYHLSASGETSWYDFANYIFQKSAQTKLLDYRNESMIYPISSHEFSALAKRPKNSSLNCDKLSGKFKYVLPHWKESVESIFERQAAITIKPI